MRQRWPWVVAVLLVVAAWLGAALLYPSLPAKVPTHWNIRGEIDGYGSKEWAAFLMPVLMTGFLILFRFLPALSPRQFEVDSFRSTYLFIMVVVVALFAYIHGLMLYAARLDAAGLKPGFDLGRVLLGGLFVFFGLIGSVMGKIQRNFYIGVRVPWTLASDRVWNDTHRLAAWLMVLGSIAGFLITISGLPLIAAIATLLVTTLAPIPYAFFHYKRLEREGSL